MKPGEDYIGITTVFACHDGNGKYLLSKRSNQCRDEQGTWDPGGGKLEHGNTLEENVRTEILEEYCAEALKIEYLGHREIFRENNGTRTHWLAHDFRVLVDPAQVQNGEPHKADEIGWFALDAFPTPTHSQWVNFYAKYKDRL